MSVLQPKDLATTGVGFQLFALAGRPVNLWALSMSDLPICNLLRASYVDGGRRQLYFRCTSKYDTDRLLEFQQGGWLPQYSCSEVLGNTTTSRQSITSGHLMTIEQEPRLRWERRPRSDFSPIRSSTELGHQRPDVDAGPRSNGGNFRRLSCGNRMRDKTTPGC